jgi:hypothetical protein
MQWGKQSAWVHDRLQLIELKKLDDFVFRWRVPLGNPPKPHWNDDHTVSGM